MRYRDIISEETMPRKDVGAEDDRVWLAYIVHHNLSSLNLNDDEINAHRVKALADRDNYPIPVSDPAFLYHGTNKSRLSKIAHDGLIPSTRANLPGLAHHSIGRLFFTETIQSAEFYAGRASKARKSHVLLRVPRSALMDAKPDTIDMTGSFYVERVVPANQIQVWNGSVWISLV